MGRSFVVAFFPANSACSLWPEVPMFSCSPYSRALMAVSATGLRLLCRGCCFPPRFPFLTPFLDLLQAVSPKRPKTDASTPRSPPLSPEQLERIRKNKEAALRRLAARTSSLVPAEIGQGWKVALAAEFNKPYLAQVGKGRNRLFSLHTFTLLCNKIH